MDRPNTMTRRSFLASTSCLGAALWTARLFPLPAMAGEVASAGQVNPQPLADKGFAFVRKVGDGVYATISDPSKGLETLSNGGFIVGTEAALLIEGFRTPAGASFQFAALALSRFAVPLRSWDPYSLLRRIKPSAGGRVR